MKNYGVVIVSCDVLKAFLSIYICMCGQRYEKYETQEVCDDFLEK